MAQYTTAQIQTWISRANKALYRLGTKSTDERFFENDNVLDRERLLIYMLKRSVSWQYLSDEVDESQLNGVISLLISRITKYDFGAQTPIYNTGTTEFIGLDDDFVVSPPSGTSTSYFWEFLVPGAPSTGFPSAGDVLWVNSLFVNRTLDVTYGGLDLPGINPGDGSIYFTKPFGSDTLTFFNLPGGLTAGALLKVRAWATGS